MNDASLFRNAKPFLDIETDHHMIVVRLNSTEAEEWDCRRIESGTRDPDLLLLA